MSEQAFVKGFKLGLKTGEHMSRRDAEAMFPEMCAGEVESLLAGMDDGVAGDFFRVGRLPLTLPEKVGLVVHCYGKWSRAEWKRIDAIIEEVLHHCRTGNGNTFIRLWCRDYLLPELDKRGWGPSRVAGYPEGKVS